MKWHRGCLFGKLKKRLVRSETVFLSACDQRSAQFSLFLSAFFPTTRMSAAQSAVYLQEMLRILPKMRLHDLEQLLVSAQQCCHIVQTSFIEASSSSPPREAPDCFLAHTPVEIAAHVIGSFLTDSDAVAWAQCSKRSLHQVQRRTFVGCASVEMALELANPTLRHRAAFGLVDKVRICTHADQNRIGTLPSHVHALEFDDQLFDSPMSYTQSEVHVPGWITAVKFSGEINEYAHRFCAEMLYCLRLPASLQCLHMPDVHQVYRDSKQLQHFFHSLPDSLTELSIPSRYASSDVYPQTWPPGLRILRCWSGIPLSQLPPLPLSLVEFDTDHSPPVHHALLPASLTRLDWIYSRERDPILLDTLTLPLALEQFCISLAHEQSLVQLLSLLPPRLRDLHLHLYDTHIATLQEDIAQAKAGSLCLSALRKLKLYIPSDDLRAVVIDQLTPYLSSSCKIIFLV
jgi:hypothetical protein